MTRRWLEVRNDASQWPVGSVAPFINLPEKRSLQIAAAFAGKEVEGRHRNSNNMAVRGGRSSRPVVARVVGASNNSSNQSSGRRGRIHNRRKKKKKMDSHFLNPNKLYGLNSIFNRGMKLYLAPVHFQ